MTAIHPASIAAHSSEKFNTRMLLYIHLKNLTQECCYTFISKLLSPPVKMSNLASNCHFFPCGKFNSVKEVVGFWWYNQDFVPIVAELCNEFNTTRLLLKIYFGIPPPHLLYVKTTDFTTRCFFLSAWKSIYRKR